MMKIVSFFVLALFSFGLVTQAGDSGLPVNLPMLASKSAMVSYQLSQSHRAYLAVYGDRLIQGGNSGLWVYESNPDKLLDTVLAQKLSYHVTEVGQIGLTLQLYNDDQQITFYGYNWNETMMNENGEVVLRDNSIQLEMTSEVPIKFKPTRDMILSGMEVRVYDRYGNLIKVQYLNTSSSADGGSWIYYPVAFLGDILAKNGYTAELQISTYNQVNGQSETVVYDPASGEQKAGHDGEVTVGSVTVKGTVRLADNSDVMAVIVTTNNVAENPVYIVKLTATKNLTVLGKTSEGALAKGFTIRQFDETGKIIGEEYLANGATLSGIGAGLYHVWFDWNEGDLVDPTNYDWYYEYHYYEGGKG